MAPPAELLESRIHLRLAPEETKAHAKDIRASAEPLRTTVNALAAASERVELPQRVRRALATVVHAELTSLKRRYKNEDFSQAAHHALIPDRPATMETSHVAPGERSAPARTGSTTPME